MKKLTVLLVAFVALLSSAFASDWHFWGKDLDQHPEFLWGFFPTYLYGGVGYTGFEFIPGHTTDIQLMAGAGYAQRKLFQDPETGRLRLLTPVECERLDGFPDNWTNTGMPQNFRYFCMGNALVVGLIEIMGKRIQEIKV